MYIPKQILIAIRQQQIEQGLITDSEASIKNWEAQQTKEDELLPFMNWFEDKIKYVLDLCEGESLYVMKRVIPELSFN